MTYHVIYVKALFALLKMGYIERFGLLCMTAMLRYLINSNLIVNYSVLKELLEKQMPAVAASVDPDEVGGAGESKKRYLILISTVMTWASTKPLDPVT